MTRVLNDLFLFFVVIALLLLSLTAMAEDAAQPQSYIFNISYEDAQDAIGKALSEKMSEEKGSDQKINATINGRKPAPLYSSNLPIEVEVRGLRPDGNGRWSASMIILGSDGNVVSAMPLAGRYTAMSEVPVFKRLVRSGELISESDLEMKSFPQDRTSSDTVISLAELVGRTPIRGISPNRPIRNSEVSAPAVIKKNALIQMRYKTASMEITASAQALMDGAKGDVIEVRNLSSKKTVHAVVADSSTVDVVSQGNQTSQIMPAQAEGQIYAQQ